MQKTELFSPISLKKLTKWILDELEFNHSIFGLPQEMFFIPTEEHLFKMKKYNQILDTPIGVAAGPHTQMAQNIIIAWLCGARFIELKTVQTLDELNITKPCIDGFDEGYNCEWSQELTLEQSFLEYLKAWILIHLLIDKFDWKDDFGTIFNISVGYNMEGILESNVQTFLARMQDSSEYKRKLISGIIEIYPKIRKIHIPDQISNNITLSTMHGCPPDEIERIGKYLIENSYHTTIKFNPTLLDPSLLRQILNKEHGYDAIVPEVAFEHDPTFDAVLQIIENLKVKAREKGVKFGVKTTNTLESKNIREILPKKEEMNYMSGRALHPITINVARKLSSQFKGTLDINLAGGVDAFNIVDVLSCNIKPVTVCTDILKPGGYSLLLQYLDNIKDKMKQINGFDLDDLICKVALSYPESYEILPPEIDKKVFFENFIFSVHTKKLVNNAIPISLRDNIDTIYQNFINNCGLFNLERYAEEVRSDKRYSKDAFEGLGLKVDVKLESFDCINTPCTLSCPISQDIPAYMYWTSKNEYNKAKEIILRDNALPNTLGRVCNHFCTLRCVRTHYEKPLAIREIKRFITEQNTSISLSKTDKNGKKVGIIGGGPSGLSAAFFLAINGFSVTIFEKAEGAGGQTKLTIPVFRLPREVNEEDIDRIRKLGVKFEFKQKMTLSKLRSQGFDYIYIAVGAMRGKKLGIDGENSIGVFDALRFLSTIKEGNLVKLGKEIAIIGGGSSALDAARTAVRVAKGSNVRVLYRRTKKEMPAEREEVITSIKEGVTITELINPKRVITKNGIVIGLECLRMKLGDIDESGRPRPIPINGSEHIINIDNLIIAIGQELVLDFLEGTKIDLTPQGFIKIDPSTLMTSINNVFAGGDAVRGPSSIVEAAGDGKSVAKYIIQKEKGQKSIQLHEIKTTRIDLLKRKSLKKPRIKIENVIRPDFSETESVLSEKDAQYEASRCLLCSEMCSICETVCPNHANLTYKVTPFEIELSDFKVQKGTLTPINNIKFKVTQPYQIINIVDFCNECGNCSTFCPTSGDPYKDKPKFFLKEKDFEDFEVSYPCNCYLWGPNETEFVLKAKIDNELHILRMNKESKVLHYSNTFIEVLIESEGFIIKEAKLKKGQEGDIYSLKECAEMYTLVKAFNESLQYFPEGTSA
jgi:putative selenate reductase